MYIYCGVAQHCQGGMTAVINPKSADDVKSFADMAAKADKNVTPKGEAFGGTVADAKGDPAESGSKTMGASSTSPTGAMSTGSGMTSTMSGSSTPTTSKAAPSSTGAASSLENQLGAAVAAAAGLAAFIL